MSARGARAGGGGRRGRYVPEGDRRTRPPGHTASGLWCARDEIEFLGPNLSPDNVLARRLRGRAA